MKAASRRARDRARWTAYVGRPAASSAIGNLGRIGATQGIGSQVGFDPERVVAAAMEGTRTRPESEGARQEEQRKSAERTRREGRLILETSDKQAQN